MEGNDFDLVVESEVEGRVVLPDKSEHEIGKGRAEFHCTVK